MELLLDTTARPSDIEARVDAHLTRIKTACREQFDAVHLASAHKLEVAMKEAMYTCRKIYEHKIGMILLLGFHDEVRKRLEQNELVQYVERVIVLVRICHRFVTLRGLVLPP